MRTLYFFALLVAFALTGARSLAQDDANIPTHRIDSIFQCYSQEKPGGQLAVSLNGQVVYSKAWGMANLETGTPLTTESLIEAGSVSKQFTAAAVLLLEKQGKLKLDDPVDKYIPGLPSYGAPILIRHLIHHTSGLREWSDIAEFAGSPQVLRVIDNNAAFRIIARQKSINNRPGEAFRYSNSNYILLPLIVEKVSGMSFADFTRQYIFEPAGMTRTQWRNDFGKVILGRSQAYELAKGKFRTAMPDDAVHGPGGLLTTAEDLLNWAAFYSTGKLGGQAMLDNQTALDTLTDGSINNYGAGLFIEHNVAKPMFHHGGATASYRARLICSPPLGLSIAWLSNTSMLDTAGFNPATAVLQMLAKPEDIAPLPRKKSDVRIDRKMLQRLTGLYKSAQSMRDVDITLGKDELELSEIPLEPVDSLRFYFFNILLSFDNTGGLAVTPPSSEPMAYYRADSAAAKTPLHEYAGKYLSDEAETAIEIVKSAAGAEMQLVSGARFAIIACSKDRFLVPDLKTDLLFKRNKKNEITAVELTTPRTLGLRFEKAKSGAPQSYSNRASQK
ncbi:CubicO group peptidase, beta-lactamase class C family [Dyadobacter soli]|uniref:CubicO group peptidase, beta-lactamase class C family n=1 Tax=Dyadobacter soli TaxID=659014 RepID=A0A1G8CC08_9BACT|nr:serine hydrolase domain-containing protein [Dyadobacter soli]SDH42925.1 CubicO group peptidase, beta-lactamase class C family [Dyadobacter soli]